MRQQNMRLLDLDFDDDHIPHSCAVSNCDPFMRPDYRGKKHTRPVGRVAHKPKLRRIKASRVLEEMA